MFSFLNVNRLIARTNSGMVLFWKSINSMFKKASIRWTKIQWLFLKVYGNWETNLNQLFFGHLGGKTAKGLNTGCQMMFKFGNGRGFLRNFPWGSIKYSDFNTNKMLLAWPSDPVLLSYCGDPINCTNGSLRSLLQINATNDSHHAEGVQLQLPAGENGIKSMIITQISRALCHD